MDKNLLLSKRELDVMKYLWNAKEAQTASTIAKETEISISTVHVAINKLLKKEIIEVDQIIFSGKVLSRCYKPTISAQKYNTKKILASVKEITNADFSTSNLVSALLGDEKDEHKVLSELNDLEKVIKEKKKELLAKSKQEKNMNHED